MADKKATPQKPATEANTDPNAEAAKVSRIKRVQRVTRVKRVQR